jgi:hypothetical protein
MGHAEMKPLLSALTLAAVSAAPVAPAFAQGGCVGKVLLPPVESRHAERVLEAPGRVQRWFRPARVERVAHRVLVSPGRETRVRLPALYRTWHGYERAPGPVRWERTAPRYDTISERVLVQPGHYVWERRSGALVPGGPPQPGQTVVTPTGEIMCKVWCPARYGVVERRVQVERGRLTPIHTTVEREVTRTVMVRPAAVQVRRTPAIYRTVYSTRVLSPGRWVVSRTAARYGWREVGRTRDGGSGWAPVVCGGPLSRPAMARMQSSLNAQGYDAGPPDGLGRPQTYSALRHFQVDHRMAAGQVTVESARALGVVP